MAKTAPVAVTTYAYQVGFGDCLLLKFEYARGARFVLIDYGSTKLPPSASKSRMVDIAKDIKAKVGANGLHAVIATHRHQDHVSGFATNANGTGSGDIIASLAPKLVVQPWTEDPIFPWTPPAQRPADRTAADRDLLRRSWECTDSARRSSDSHGARREFVDSAKLAGPSSRSSVRTTSRTRAR